MISKGLLRECRAILGRENVWDDEPDRAAYAYDASVLEPVMPCLVLRPTSEEALGKVVALCNENQLPLTVRGAGTNLSGGTIPNENGVVVLTTGLRRIREVNEQDLFAVVEPGVVTAALAAEAERRGLFYPPDPGSQAVSTIGGNVAENAGGLRGLKYGVTRDYVMGMRFFDVHGQSVVTGARTVKCASGYNLAGLMVGSEGTLAVFSEITLKLVPRPACRRALMAVFDDVAGASETVSAIVAKPIVPATLEFLDNFTIRSVEDYSGAGLPVEAAAMLLVELDGHPAHVEDDAQAVASICREHGAKQLRIAHDDEEHHRVWEARRAALSALARVRPTLVLEDATVPRSKIPDMVRAIDTIRKRFDLTIGVFGHAGDGNLHPTICTDRRDHQEWQRVERAIEAIFENALALGGTLTGEHGIGLAKSRFLEDETSPATTVFSRRIKLALDPNNILNRGKMIGG